MPIYIPWLSETIKKRGVRYLLHHYLGQFFEEKLTLEQLSIDIYEGKGSIRDLALDVDGLNDELDFIPFRFLDGCSIGQISVEVPWSSLATEACKVELDGARLVCRLKTVEDASKTHCTESTLLSRSLMTSSMQMAEDIVTTEDDDDYGSATSSAHCPSSSGEAKTKQKDATQMFEGLEMFAQLIDSVLRRTKLTAHNTLFQIQPYCNENENHEGEKIDSVDGESDQETAEKSSDELQSEDSSQNDEIRPRKSEACDQKGFKDDKSNSPSKGTVEFFIKFFRCEELVDGSDQSPEQISPNQHQDISKKSVGTMPESVTKLITLEEVEMRIDGVPVSNLIGKHAITIKFNGQKSEISIFSGSPLLAVISHKQLETFITVFDSPKSRDQDIETAHDKNQKMMSQEDYAKIENQLLEDASLRNMNMLGSLGNANESSLSTMQSQHHTDGQISQQGRRFGGRLWGDANGGGLSSSINQRAMDFEYHSPNSSNTTPLNSYIASEPEPTLDNIEAFSCELKLPGIWLCILRSDETLPPLIKPHADSINSFQSINKFIDHHIKVPHIRCLALRVALDITAAGTNIFLGDLNIVERFNDDAISPFMTLLQNDMTDMPLESARYKASMVNNDIVVESLTNTRVLFDPTIIDRLVFDYKLLQLSSDVSATKEQQTTGRSRASQPFNFNLTIRSENFTAEIRCPIPDLTPEGLVEETQLRPQSFLTSFKDISSTWQMDKLTLTCLEMKAFLKMQPNQNDSEAIMFIEASSKDNDKIVLTLEPSPSNLETAFPNDVEQVLNESSMYDSIYVGQATESRIAAEPFQTKRKVVRASAQDTDQDDGDSKEQSSECDYEKILTPGDKEHLESYLSQTAMSTKLSINLHLPICEVEFEDKEQLDLIYNRLGNDFVFWQPKCLNKPYSSRITPGEKLSGRDLDATEVIDRVLVYKDAQRDNDSESSQHSDRESEVSFHSLTYGSSGNSDCFENLVTCKTTVGEFFVKFNHQSCAVALQQDITAENLLFGLIIDVNRKPNTLLSLVAENLELRTDSNVVLQGNTYSDKSSTFGLTAEIKRPTKALKDIKLAIQLVNGLFNDFKSVTFARFWQSINVTDEPIAGYIAPRIVTELHIDILDTALSLVKDGARPALLSIDELYMTSMVMESTSKVMIRMIADEVSLYLKRDRQALELMKNYICVVDSGVIDLDVEFSDDGKLKFGVINNVITVRVCQDSLIALCKLFNVMVRGSKLNQAQAQAQAGEPQDYAHDEEKVQDEDRPSSRCNKTPVSQLSRTTNDSDKSESRAPKVGGVREDSIDDDKKGNEDEGEDEDNDDDDDDDDDDDVERALANLSALRDTRNGLNLLEDAMNDYDGSTKQETGSAVVASEKINHSTDNEQPSSDEDEDEASDEDDGDDSDASSQPPAMMHRSSGRASSSRSRSAWPLGGASLMDESNPGDLTDEPLLAPSQAPMDKGRADEQRNVRVNGYAEAESLETTSKAIDESGFFVIGDDDVGAGIINQQQHSEPVVRKLIDGQISIIDNHFKMTKPRSIPEMLATSLERYVLREMTLVVNVFGGRDFDDPDCDEQAEQNETLSSAASATTNVSLQDQDTSVDTISTSVDNLVIRGRANSLAAVRKSVLKQTSSDLAKSRRASARPGTAGGGGGGQRRKHLSESGKDIDKGDSRVRFGEGAVNLWESLDLMSSPDFISTRRPTTAPLSVDSKLAGGTWRRNDVCIQLTLSKVKVLYEVNDPNELNINLMNQQAKGAQAQSSTSTTTSTSASSSGAGAPIAWRFMLFIQDIEVCDLVQASDINKMLYEYCTESMPKRSTQILTIKNIATVNPSDGCEECDLRVSLKPLRLNIDQDTLLFLIEFFTAINKALAKQQSLYAHATAPAPAATSSTAPASGTAPGASVASSHKSTTAVASPHVSKGSNSPSPSGVSGELQQRHQHQQSRRQAQTIDQEQQRCASEGAAAAAAAAKSNSSGNANIDCQQHHHNQDQLPTHCHSDLPISGSSNQYPIYIKSFTFSPDVPIRLDYHAKHLDFEQGAIAGILMGLAHLDHSELVLRRVQAKHGMRGLDRVILFILNSWLTDIKRNQLPSILGGVGPMHSVIQLFQGMRDLIWMPIDHYRKDKRLVRGLQRGASSFSSSTAMAAINLVNRFISIVQCTAQIAYDIVTPPNHHHTNLPIGCAADFDSYCAAGSGGAGHRCHHKRRHNNSLASTLIGAAVTSIGGSHSHNHHSHQRHSSSNNNNNNHHHHHHHHSHSSSVLARKKPLAFSSTSGAGSSVDAESARPVCSLGRRLRSSSGNQASPMAQGSGCSPTMSASGARPSPYLCTNTTLTSSRPSAATAGSCGLSQPRNFCEGVAVGYSVIKEGFNDTARNVTVSMQADDVRSAVGELVRQIPSTLLNPIISATEGAQNVLVGIRNQIAPDARRDDQEKWKRRARRK